MAYLSAPGSDMNTGFEPVPHVATDPYLDALAAFWWVMMTQMCKIRHTQLTIASGVKGLLSRACQRWKVICQLAMKSLACSAWVQAPRTCTAAWLSSHASWCSPKHLHACAVD
jgi:hypothetical protein